MTKKYLPKEIEGKWQKKWQEEKLYFTDLSNSKNHYYVLVELAYTSGDLHLGHWFTFSMGDILARFKRMQGYNVVFPNGFDAFGLPAENAAIKEGIHPSDFTYSNVERMTSQFKTMGSTIDWEKTMVACDLKYYKWNQWIFLKMLEKGLAYKGKLMSNWCPNDQTVLANENVEAGKCWRCGSDVIQKEIEQWFLKITDYADKLIWTNSPQVNWPKSLREAQNSWIGKSQGMVLDFDGISVFTTRPETTDGATFLVLAPEHPKVKNLTKPKHKDDIESYIKVVKSKSELERKEDKDKTGVFTGSYVTNPVTNQKIPVWVADYVLMEYGTGAIMAVPAADERDKEFAKKFNLSIVETSFQAKPKGEKKVNYHLHDWSISRQRYWGTPVPIIYCDKCGMVPVPEKDLPVELPYKVDYAPKGKPPLATAKDWVNVSCPKCAGPAKREVETMDTFIDSSWYFFRYLDPQNDQEIFDKKIISDWMPADIYIGGAEHTLGHALYSRFVSKFLKDLGLIKFDEYADKRIHHGTILGPDGARMSKSKGNVINPDEQVKEFGADSVRVYLAFLGPYDIVTSWKTEGINGIYHFLQRVWGLFDKIFKDIKLNFKDLNTLNRTIKKVGEDIEVLKNNTAIAALMEWLNYLSRKEKISQEEYKTFLILLAPFAPHITEELWSMLGGKFSIHQQSWPKVDKKYLEESQINIVVQINGKVRDVLLIDKDIVKKESDIKYLALKSKRIQKFLEKKSPKKTIYVQGRVINLVI